MVNEAASTPAGTTPQDIFSFNLEALRADAVGAVENPIIRDAILRVKHGQESQGFTNAYDKAYHSHSKT